MYFNKYIINSEISKINNSLILYSEQYPKKYREIIKNIYWHPLIPLIANIDDYKKNEYIKNIRYKIILRLRLFDYNDKDLSFLSEIEKKYYLNTNFKKNYLLSRAILPKPFDFNACNIKSEDKLIFYLLNNGYRCLSIEDNINYINYLIRKLKNIKSIKSSLSRMDSFNEVFILGVCKYLNIDIQLFQHGAMYNTDYGFGPDYFIDRISCDYHTYFAGRHKCVPARYMNFKPDSSWKVLESFYFLLISPNFSRHYGITPCVSSSNSENKIREIMGLGGLYKFSKIIPPRDRYFKISGSAVLNKKISDVISDNSICIIFDLSSIFYELIFARKPFVCILDDGWNIKEEFFSYFKLLFDFGIIRFDKDIADIDIIYKNPSFIESLEALRRDLFSL
ncbi:hypothetical protein G6659_01700 [Polynucleobacter paneuropaeus]|nr:hypothetical protein G6659_01700 [Polynucleobacter paneuropaeus]